MESFSLVFAVVLFALIFAETAATVRSRAAVRGTRERYVAMTQRRVLSWAVNVGFGVQGMLGLVAGQPLAVLSLAMAFYLSYLEVKNHKDDDDWFNGRGKKIRAGLKRRLAARRASRRRTPVRIPAPSPVFG